MVPCWNRPYIVYKYVFHSSSLNYFKDAIKKLIILFLMGLIISLITHLITFDNLIVVILWRLFVCISIFSIVVIIIFRKNEEFKFYVEFIKTKILHK